MSAAEKTANYILSFDCSRDMSGYDQFKNGFDSSNKLSNSNDCRSTDKDDEVSDGSRKHVTTVMHPYDVDYCCGPKNGEKDVSISGERTIDYILSFDCSRNTNGYNQLENRFDNCRSTDKDEKASDTHNSFDIFTTVSLPSDVDCNYTSNTRKVQSTSERAIRYTKNTLPSDADCNSTLKKGRRKHRSTSERVITTFPKTLNCGKYQQQSRINSLSKITNKFVEVNSVKMDKNSLEDTCASTQRESADFDRTRVRSNNPHANSTLSTVSKVAPDKTHLNKLEPNLLRASAGRSWSRRSLGSVEIARGVQ